MEINLENFSIRRTKPYIAGQQGMPKDVERYTVKGEGILGIEVFRDDKIKIINLEGSQEMELTFFNDVGENISLINKNLDKDAYFTKFILKNSNDKNSLIKKLKNKKINIDKIKSLNFFNKETEAGTEENLIIEVRVKKNGKEIKENIYFLWNVNFKGNFTSNKNFNFKRSKKKKHSTFTL